MEVSCQFNSFKEDNGESGDSDPEYDSDEDPSYSILEETHAKFSNLSIEKKKKSKARIAEDMNMGSKGDPHEVGVVVPELDEEDAKSFEKVQKIIEDGQLEKLKVDQCKVYLRKNRLRLTGNKDTLIQRIKEHREIVNGGEKKYPISSFVLNCKGDACTGDVVMFEQNVYEIGAMVGKNDDDDAYKFNIASRSASGPPCGTRIVAGRIVKESYGAAKQQHTFTIEVLWSKGEKPFPPLHPLLIKGRNLYRLKTLRQRWEDEGERRKILMDKHSRGCVARSDREARIQEKEMRKVLKETRKESKRNHSQFNSSLADAIQPLQSGKPAVSQQQFGVSIAGKPSMRYQQPGLLSDLGEPTMQSQPADLSLAPPRQAALQSNYRQQASHNIVGCREVPHLRGYEFHSNYMRPNFHPNDHQVPANKYSNVSGTRGSSSSDSTYHRQPLANMNLFPPMNPLPRQGHKQPQLCRYYAQGRCHFGDNCKFVHESRRTLYL